MLENQSAPKEARKTDFGLRFLQLAITFIGLAVIYFGYLVFQPAPDIKVTEPIKLDKVVVNSDDTMTLQTKYCSNGDATQRFDVQLIDLEHNSSAYTIYTVDEAKLKNGCHDMDMAVKTGRFSSFSVSSGQYTIRLRATTKVNPIKYIVKHYDSQRFQYNA